MVRKGSSVRVRCWALQKPRKCAVSLFLGSDSQDAEPARAPLHAQPVPETRRREAPSPHAARAVKRALRPAAAAASVAAASRAARALSNITPARRRPTRPSTAPARGCSAAVATDAGPHTDPHDQASPSWPTLATTVGY